MKQLSQSQLIGERGELLAGERAMSMGFAFDQKGRLETGVDGMLELRDPRTGRMLAKWIGAQVKTTESGRYSYEDDEGFEYPVLWRKRHKTIGGRAPKFSECPEPKSHPSKPSTP